MTTDVLGPCSDLPPAVQDAWNILFGLDIGLRPQGAHPPSDTARRVCDTLDNFARSYTDHFIAFAKDEQTRQECIVPSKTTAKLRKRVGPLMEFKKRLEEALEAAEKEVAAYDLETLSQSLRQAEAQRKKEAEEAAIRADQVDIEMGSDSDGDGMFPIPLVLTLVFTVHPDPKTPIPGPFRHSSPTKRCGEPFESPLTKSFRAIASTSRRCPPPFSIAGPSKPLPVVAEAESVETDDDRWTPIPAKSEDERYLLVTIKTPYQARIFNCDVRFHTQWELECAMMQCGLSYDDIEFADFSALRGPAAEAAARISGLLVDVCMRKGKTEAAEIAKRYGQDERLKAIRREVDREEAALQARSRKGKEKEEDDNQPYGGKIAYTIQLDYLAKNSKVNGQIRSRPDDFAPWVRPSANPPASPASQTLFFPHNRAGPTDDLSNPFGLAVKALPAQKLPSFLAYLESPNMPGKSSRLARELGPGRILTIKLPPKASQAQLRQLFEGTVLVVLGRPFRALFATPDGKRVYAVETDEVLPGRFARRPESQIPVSFGEILQRYNDLEQKPGQPMAKWGSRLKIYLSDSVPILRVDPSAVMVIPDVISSFAVAPNHPETEEILTDGCGLMSKYIARQVYEFLGRNGPIPPTGHPSAIQIRFGGSKGMLVVMSDEQERLYPGRHIVLRPSMIKASASPQYAEDPSHFSLDLVRWTSLKVGVGLSAEPMPIMVDRGVPKSVFVKLQETVLDELRTAFQPSPAEGESEADAARRLRDNVYGLGGVGQEARKRECKEQGKSQRVAGLTWKDEAEEDKDVGVSDEARGTPAAVAVYDVCPVSHQPHAIAEALYNALCAGFHPLHSAYPAAKLRALVKMQCETIVNRFRLPIKQSLSAFIVPDPLGVLAPNEIFISTDEQLILDPLTQKTTWCLSGPVLALRVPCKLPTDVKKMVAVYKPELAHLRNVIVMSANSALCRRSPANDLSGGDYDGDTVQLYWDPELVGPFVNAPEEGAVPEPGFIEANFEKRNITGTEVLEGVRGLGEEGRVINLQRFLLGGLGGDTLTSKYSDWHGNAQYTLGVSHPHTVRLGRMSGFVLDACKSGLQVREDVLKRDAEDFGGELEWRCAKKGKALHAQYAARELQRPKNLGKYVMDELHKIGQSRIAFVLSSFPEWTNAYKTTPDYDALSSRIKGVESSISLLSEPYRSECTRQLHLLTSHVKACHSIWEDINSGKTPPDSILNQYTSRLAACMGNTAILPPTPMTPRRKSSAYSESTDDDAKRAELRRLRMGYMRDLARVWRDQLTPKDLPGLCVMGLGEEWVRELKVSAGAGVVGNKAKQVFVFDMDYTMTCAMRAKADGGKVVTLRDEVWTTSRPRRR